MDYEKEYKSLVAKIKKAYLFALTDSTKNVLVDILPELREKGYEDERTRREIYALVRARANFDDVDRMLAYLEKLKIFSEKGEGVYGYKDGKICFLGKWLDNSMYPCDAPVGRDIDGNLVYMEDLEGEKQKEPHYTKRNALFDKCVENCDPAIMKEVSDNVDKMLEKDLKPAEWDELQADFRNINETFEEGKKEVVAHPEKYGLCKPAEIDEYKIIKKHITEDSLSSEVTKRLKECGWYVTYEKPAEWSADDEKMMNRVFDSYDALRSYFEDDEVRSEDDKNNLIKELKEEVSWLNNRIKSLHLQPKQEWSEEDEKMRNSIIADYERSNKEWFTAQCSIPWGKKIDWLKALHLQKKCSDCAKNIEGYIHGRSDAENKLLEQFGAIITPEGELRIKPRWKPSGEQMGALSWMLENARANTDFDPLKDLYEQLKKL